MNTDTVVEVWEGNPVTFQKDAYVNATLMCVPFGKEVYEFLRLPGTRRFVEALSADTGLSGELLVITRKGGDQSKPGKSRFAQGGAGTWLHPDLGLELARWLDPRFAIWCNRVIRKHLSGELSVKPTGEIEVAKLALELAKQTHEELRQVQADLRYLKEILMPYGVPGFALARRRSQPRESTLIADPHAREGMERLLAIMEERGVEAAQAGQMIEMVCDAGLFPWITKGRSVPAQRSALGKIFTAFRGQKFQRGDCERTFSYVGEKGGRYYFFAPLGHN